MAWQHLDRVLEDETQPRAVGQSGDEWCSLDIRALSVVP